MMVKRGRVCMSKSTAAPAVAMHWFLFAHKQILNAECHSPPLLPPRLPSNLLIPYLGGAVPHAPALL